jgi:DNA-directed RNA polymerase specialized sigma24 family protein
MHETATRERIPDPAVPEFGADWDVAWEKNLLVKALEQLRAQIDERQFQVFDCCVNKGWAPADVAQTLGISVARVYLTKHRVAARLKREVQRLEKLAESPASSGSVASTGAAPGARS